MDYTNFNKALYSMETLEEGGPEAMREYINDALDNGDFEEVDAGLSGNSPSSRSEEGIGAIVALGGSILAAVGKGLAGIIATIAGCPTIMMVIFIVIVACGLIGAFVIWASSEAEEKEESGGKTMKLMSAIKNLAGNKEIEESYSKCMEENILAYKNSMQVAWKYEPELDKSIKCKTELYSWKREKFTNNILRSGLSNLIKKDKMPKNLKSIPIYDTNIAGIKIHKPRPKDQAFVDALARFAKKISNDRIVFRVNDKKTMIVCDHFNLSLSDDFVNKIKGSAKKQ